MAETDELGAALRTLPDAEARHAFLNTLYQSLLQRIEVYHANLYRVAYASASLLLAVVGWRFVGASHPPSSSLKWIALIALAVFCIIFVAAMGSMIRHASTCGEGQRRIEQYFHAFDEGAYVAEQTLLSELHSRYYGASEWWFRGKAWRGADRLIPVISCVVSVAIIVAW